MKLNDSSYRTLLIIPGKAAFPFPACESVRIFPDPAEQVRLRHRLSGRKCSDTESFSRHIGNVHSHWGFCLSCRRPAKTGAVLDPLRSAGGPGSLCLTVVFRPFAEKAFPAFSPDTVRSAGRDFLSPPLSSMIVLLNRCQIKRDERNPEISGAEAGDEDGQPDRSSECLHPAVMITDCVFQNTLLSVILFTIFRFSTGLT